MVQWAMLKTEAIELLGGSIPAAADAIGVTYQAVYKWPEVLPAKLVDRVQAALWRKAKQEDRRTKADRRTTKAEG